MRIRIVAPVLHSKELVEKARAEYEAAAGAGVDISVVCVANGTRSIESELDVALESEAAIIGINNRDLRTFHTTLETTLELLPLVPAGPLVVSESGFFTGADVRRVVAAGAHAVLVGEALVRAPDIGAKIRDLTLRAEGACC